MIEDICLHNEFKEAILSSGTVASIISAIKDSDPSDKENTHFNLNFLKKSCLQSILNLLKNEKEDKIKVLI